MIETANKLLMIVTVISLVMMIMIKYELIVDTGGKFGGKSTSVKIRLKVPWAGSTLICSKKRLRTTLEKNVFALLGK